VLAKAVMTYCRICLRYCRFHRLGCTREIRRSSSSPAVSLQGALTLTRQGIAKMPAGVDDIFYTGYLLYLKRGVRDVTRYHVFGMPLEAKII